MAMKPLVTAAMLAALSVLAAPAQVSLPEYPDVWGVSAPVAGFQGRMLVVGGGCNFPTLDAADGGRKTYYYKTYDNSQITAVPMDESKREGSALICHPLVTAQQFRVEK